MLSSEITNVLMGNTEAQALYLGDELLWQREIDTCPQIQYPLPSDYSTILKPIFAFYVEVPAGETLAVTVRNNYYQGDARVNFNGFELGECPFPSPANWRTHTHTYTTSYYGWISLGAGNYPEDFLIASKNDIKYNDLENAVAWEDCKIWKYAKAFYCNKYNANNYYRAKNYYTGSRDFFSLLTNVVTIYDNSGYYKYMTEDGGTSIYGSAEVNSNDVIFYRVMNDKLYHLYLSQFKKLCTCDFVKYLTPYVYEDVNEEDYVPLPQKGYIYVSQETYNSFTTKDLQTIASKNYNITIKT